MGKIQAGIKFGIAVFVFLLSLFTFSQITRSYADKMSMWKSRPANEQLEIQSAPRTFFRPLSPTASLQSPLVSSYRVKVARNVSINLHKSLRARQGEEKTKVMVVPAAQPLIAHDDLQASIGFLPYERILGKGVRFRYTSIEGERIGHAWFFAPRNLRGKTIRVFYAGIVPREITFSVSRSSTSARVHYRFEPKDSAQTQVLSFKVPDKLPFDRVALFEFVIEKERASRPYGDFLVERVEVLDDDALNMPAIAKNQTPSFAFGNNYFQSNIWGGEVRAS